MFDHMPDYGLMLACAQLRQERDELKQLNERLVAALKSTTPLLHFLATKQNNEPITSEAQTAYGSTLALLAEIDAAKAQKSTQGGDRPCRASSTTSRPTRPAVWSTWWAAVRLRLASGLGGGGNEAGRRP